MMLMWLIAGQLAAAAAAEAPPFDPVTGYRTARYRGIVPHPPEGARRIDASRAEAMNRDPRVTFIDVTPAEGGSRNPATGEWRLAIEHRTLPRARWFPESGRGRLAPAIERWFASGIARHAGSTAAPVVVFCLSDCWMSWNAALRLHRAGYRDVRWFADGVDGWRERGLPMVAAVPEPGAIGE